MLLASVYTSCCRINVITIYITAWMVGGSDLHLFITEKYFLKIVKATRFSIYLENEDAVLKNINL